ncbi:MAG: sulfotransferase, partial [Patescibacteria group bacterium]
PKKKSLNTWKHHYNRALSLFKDNVDEKSIIHVQYETIAISPRDELKRICNFLGIDFEEAMLNYAAKPNHTTNGNDKVRFRKSSEIKLDTSWCEHLSDEDQRYFESRAGQLNKKLGYK